MRGGPSHEWMISLLEQAAHEAGCQATRQHPVRMGGSVGFIDLLVVNRNENLAIEVERSTRRIASDIQKAATLKAELWIVVPGFRMAMAVQTKIQSCSGQVTAPIKSLTLGAAIKRFSEINH